MLQSRKTNGKKSLCFQNVVNRPRHEKQPDYQQVNTDNQAVHNYCSIYKNSPVYAADGQIETPEPKTKPLSAGILTLY